MNAWVLLRIAPMTDSDCIDLLWLGSSGGPLIWARGAARVACPAWAGLSRVAGPVWGSEIDSKVVCVCVCEVGGMGVNLPELGQMLLTSSSQVDSLRGKMASNPPGVRAFGLTHWEPSLSTAPSSVSSPFTHPLTPFLTALSGYTRKSHVTVSVPLLL